MSLNKLYKEGKDFTEENADKIRKKIRAIAPLLTFKFQQQKIADTAKIPDTRRQENFDRTVLTSTGGSKFSDNAVDGTFAVSAEGEHWITISSPEYTSICPFSAWPDFGTVTIEYVPDKVCLELKSFKLYIHAFRNVKIFHETVTEVIFADFLEAVKPQKAKITVDMNVRGNVKTVCTKHYKTHHDQCSCQ